MEQYIIKGGHPLVGEVEIGGAKNAALAILVAAIMTDETVVIDNIPDVSDINVLLDAIAEMGAMVQRVDRHTVRINGSTVGNVSVDYESMKKIRGSYYFLGALLGELSTSSSFGHALKVASLSFVAFLLTTGFKLIYGIGAIIMTVVYLWF
jgi:UDP-N-acetylglucosamine 1-carboxyvinyltransferase